MAPPTHPFITFEFDTRGIDARTWMLLGEALSKCQHLAGAPLKPGAATELASVSLARGVQATTAIEGNTLSDEEVREIVDKGSAGVSESRAYLEREVQNVLGAVRDIDHALGAEVRLPINVDRIRGLNKQVLDGIPDKPEVVPGEFRQHDVAVGPYKAPHWTEVPDLVGQLVNWLGNLRPQTASQDGIEGRFTSAVLSAILAHLYIAWIHPFGNGNGRTARLIEVQILSESGIVPIVATNILSDHYNKTRNAYYLALDEARKDVMAFVRYAIRGFVDELRAQIHVVRQHNLQINWESYVYETFNKMPNTDARSRQRAVALLLPEGAEITPEDVTDLSTSLARKYALCGERTPARDMNDLAKLGLVEKTGKRTYRARREMIQAFIPPVAAA
ncbi:Fic family protein [Amycolatopsis sp. GM8]|uniref:Fic family protein n=1 Tax=Amycolatopsis sp. GM8 TaxID=2896530 RepID=UPI001F31C8DB|nr:Fic family protein [Amycolatopsis sp. GM8]